MYTKCKDSFIDSINSPILSSQQNSTIFSNISFLLNSIPESIIIISEKGIILEINSATSRLFGWTKDEIINRKNISFLLTNRDGEKLMNIINNEEISSFIDFTYHYHGLNKNGTTFPCDISFGIFPKSFLDNSSTSSSSSNNLLQSNNVIIAVINTNKKGNRTSDSVLLDLKSRYQNEYDEIEALGKGGFGQVYKARNRLDGQLYAIKKIKLQSKPKEFSNSFDLHAIENLKTVNSNNATATTTSNLSFLSAEDLRIVREVKTFARISNHPNIVRYHASWIEVEEKVPRKNKKKDDYDSDSSDCSSEYDENDNESESFQVQNNSISYSNNNSLSNNINISNQNISLNSNDHLNLDNQPSNNDFIISFDDTRNTGNNNNNNNNSNEFFIDMGNLDSLHSDKSDNESTDINSLEDYNPFSFRQGNEESISIPDDQEQQYYNDTSDKIDEIKNLKKKDHGKIELDPRNISVMKPLEKQNNLRLFLIIQMELCSGQTLETWIRDRNKLTEKKEIHIDRKVIFKIFKQIVQAIAHVHWNGCIHRDVKPANVFLQDDNHILLGDFGLAKDVDFNVSTSNSETVADTLPISTTLVANESESELELDSESDSESEISKNNKYSETRVNSTHISNAPNLTSGVGTYIYASPEQLASSQGYDNKTDIYSLGILLFELLWPFKTGMERIKTLTNIRKGEFPDNFVEKWPLELPFLKSLLNPDPTLRPTAQEILDSEVLNINYITPLYNNPTNLLNALDLRVTHVTLDPNESIVMTSKRKSKERKGHNKTLSNASKIIKNYGDCGACKQKDLAISSFRNQFIKTKVTISELENTVAKTSKRVWVMSILTFILGCILTLGVTLLIFNHTGRLYKTSSIGNTDVNVKANLNNLDIENPNYDSSAFVSEITPVPEPIPIAENNKNEHINSQIDNTYPEIKSFTEHYQNNIDNKDKNQFSKRNKQNKNKNFVKEKKNTRENIIVTQTLSINYFYTSNTLTVTKTRTKAIHFEAIATNTQPFDSTPTN